MNPIVTTLIPEYDVIHRRMKDAIEGLDQPALDWTPGLGTNSIDVLVTHTLGSSLEWLHAAAARPMPNQRDRDAEFLVTDRGAAALVAEIDRVSGMIPDLLQEAAAGDFFSARVRPRDGREATAIWMALHALEHANEHIGHIEMTRQLLPMHAGSL